MGTIKVPRKCRAFYRAYRASTEIVGLTGFLGFGACRFTALIGPAGFREFRTRSPEP